MFVSDPNPLSNMSIILASNSVHSQAIKVYTDVEQEKPSVVCPITATISPAEAFASITSDFSTIEMDGVVLTQTIPSSVKTHTFVVTVSSSLFPSLVQPVTLAFDVIVTCSVTDI